GSGSGGDETLPQIDRVVLYIDDLDRCPPKRVVEVLEAVHLILALDLFVVVLAVDPRWLLQSLRLHYSELLGDEEQLDPEWESTPLNYLEKIIQIPFTLRPMGEGGIVALVAGLLPVRETAAGDDPRPPAETAPDASETVDAGPAQPAPAPRALTEPVASRRVTGSNPRGLLLTSDERDFAAVVARGLRTPRSVKKLTNLYRLVRARLDEESGELDAFLLSSGRDIPAYQAVLMLLTVLIAFPDEAAEFLLSFGDLDPDHRPDPVSWTTHQEQLRGELAAFLKRATAATAKGEETSTEPFRRWARELSRYSFETGQEVFSKVR
ncbi:MAG: P-loop NTPase fold protein, partial [Solirubrobacterales bacterium]